MPACLACRASARTPARHSLDIGLQRVDLTSEVGCEFAAVNSWMLTPVRRHSLQPTACLRPCCWRLPPCLWAGLPAGAGCT